jgi:PAS domain S-box-containing protein
MSARAAAIGWCLFRKRWDRITQVLGIGPAQLTLLQCMTAISQHEDRQEMNMPSLEALEKVFTVVPDPMVLVNSLGTIVLVNGCTCKLFGYTQNKLIGQSIACLIPKSYLASHKKQLEGYFSSPTVRSMGIGMELLAKRADGSEFPVEISLSPYRRAGEVFAVAAIRDVTERMQLVKAQRESQRQAVIAEERARVAQDLASKNEALRAIFEASPLGIITTSQDGAIVRWNQAAERIYGYSSREAIGSTIGHLIQPLAPNGDPATVLDAAEMTHRMELRDFEICQRRKDGLIIDVSLSSTTFHDASGSNAGFLFLVDDISERKKIAQQLRQAQKMESVGQLTGGIAHDFNNILSIIICNLGLLQEKLALGSEDRELNDGALSAGLHGADLVKQLLAFSRKQNLAPQKIMVNELVQSTINLLARSLGEDIEIILEMEADIWPAIADPVQLETALVNLATNARDAMPNGGSLVIQTKNTMLEEAYVRQFADLSPGEYVMIAVTDSGSGMTKETAERAFDPFFTTKPPGVGTGLGLSMVFGFVKQSGGNVRILSEPGHGTTVYLYLPRATGKRGTPTTGVKRVKAALPKILIVEDNGQLAKSAHRVLSNAGYEAKIAMTGEEALDTLRTDASFDVLFTDIILTRGMNGIELAQEAARLKPTIKILFSSGFSEAALVASGKAVVQDRFIAKPYRREALIAKIRSLTRNGKSGGSGFRPIPLSNSDPSQWDSFMPASVRSGHGISPGGDWAPREGTQAARESMAATRLTGKLLN